jgi:hypothetical protein
MILSAEFALGKRKRKQREKKDPNQPKRPTSAYLLFQNDVRKFYQDKMAGQPYSEVMSEIAKQWKELPEERKAVSPTPLIIPAYLTILPDLQAKS